MAKIEDCPGFESFGADGKATRKAKKITQRALAETLHVAVRYLADIESVGKIPSVPVLIQLIRICGLPGGALIMFCSSLFSLRQLSYRVSI